MEGELNMAYEEIKNHGISSNTPKNIFLGAGTIHKGLTFATSAWNFAESLIGATSGGSKLTIVPELKDIELDGADVKTKGLTIKTGETAKLETNLAEVTPEIMRMAMLGNIQLATGKTGYSEIVSGGQIEAGDYVNGLAYIGKTLDGRPIIVMFDYALCTSGLEIEGKNKENGVIKLTFECYADMTADLTKLPYHIYFPTVVV